MTPYSTDDAILLAAGVAAGWGGVRGGNVFTRSGCSLALALASFALGFLLSVRWFLLCTWVVGLFLALVVGA